MKRTFLFKSITATLLMGTASLGMAQSAPINNLDCSEEEIMSYASKDNYEEPIGISVMPSVAEYKPAYTMQEMTEKKDLPAAEKGCPTIIPEDAWDSIVGEYKSAVDSIKAAIEALNNASFNPNISADGLSSAIQGLMDRIKEEANKSVCTRISELNLDSYSSEVMWDVIDERFGFDEKAYEAGNKTVIHEIIKDQNRQSDSELVGLLDQMGVEGEDVVGFFADSGLETDGILNEGNDLINDDISDGIGDIGDEMFGDSDNPFDDTIDDITGDIEDGAQEGTNIN